MAKKAETADVRRWMLAHGLLAPNPHNRQPWIADLQTAGQIKFVCDGDRLLPETDPFGRQILIGCGAFIELVVMAAAERGYRVRVEAFPDGEPGPRELPGGRVGARLLLEPDPSLAQDPLFVQIKQRHTNKGPFDLTRTVPAPVWQSFQACATDKGLVAGAVTNSAEMGKVREITRNSFETEILTQRTYLQSARLMRIGPDEVSRHRDGIPLMGSMVRTLSAVGM